MCGTVSAIGLEDRERELWPYVRERLRRPGELMALMRGVLGDAEVGVVASVTPQGRVTPLAILATPQEIVDEITLLPPDEAAGEPGSDRAHSGGLWPAKVGDYDAVVLVGEGPDGKPRPVAILTTPWIEQHLLLYARDLWRKR